MRLEEEFVGKKLQFAELLRRVADQIAADELSVHGRKVQMPDTDMEYKLSHKFEHGEHRFTLKIEWLDRDSLPEPQS